jgi:hypothetical protein
MQRVSIKGSKNNNLSLPLHSSCYAVLSKRTDWLPPAVLTIFTNMPKMRKRIWSLTSLPPLILTTSLTLTHSQNMLT